MNAVHLISTKAYPYAGRELKPGDAFDAPPEDAHILKGVGQAKDATVAVDAPIATAAPRGNAAAGDGLPFSDEDSNSMEARTDTGRRKYRRRDMVAQNSGK